MTKPNVSISSRSIALGGILTAITIICLFLATVLPTSRLSFYALSSFSTAVVVLEFGAGRGAAFYCACSILSFIIIPNKLAVVPFAVFFGNFGILKYYIEKVGKPIPEIILKLAYFNICLFPGLFFMKKFLLAGNSKLLDFPLGAFVLLFQVIFIIYDFVYTLFIQYYNLKLKRIFKI